jgi:hypothetical protein
MLLYFAASYRKPYFSWSAISRPPYLTALALWPKGDGWGGGGHFLSDADVSLNHRAGETTLGDGFSIPEWMRVKPFGGRPGCGEDDPVWLERLKRDGWVLIDYGKAVRMDDSSQVWITLDPPRSLWKPHPSLPDQYGLEMSISGVYEKDGPWYVVQHSILQTGGTVLRLGRSDWADWSHSGDLLFSKDGCLFRVPFNGKSLTPLEGRVKVADFRGLKFEKKEAPTAMREWPSR